MWLLPPAMTFKSTNGASFTGVTFTKTVPVPVPPRSSNKAYVNDVKPTKSTVGVKVTLPAPSSEATPFAPASTDVISNKSPSISKSLSISVAIGIVRVESSATSNGVTSPSSTAVGSMLLPRTNMSDTTPRLNPDPSSARNVKRRLPGVSSFEACSYVRSRISSSICAISISPPALLLKERREEPLYTTSNVVAGPEPNVTVVVCAVPKRKTSPPNRMISSTGSTNPDNPISKAVAVLPSTSITTALGFTTGMSASVG